MIKEPKNVDFTLESEPWTEEELRDFRKVMNEMKLKNAKRKRKMNALTKKVIAKTF